MKETPFPHCWPRGLSRVYAAHYIGVPLAIWDKMVADGTMPKPKRTHGRTIWDRLAVDRAFDLIDGGNVTAADGEEIWESEAGTNERLSIESRRSLPNWGLSETDPTTWLTEEEAELWMEEYRKERKERTR